MKPLFRLSNMRVSIREQLGCLILISSLVGLAVISVSVWCTNQAFVLSVAATRLQVAASLKAAQIAGNLGLMQTVANFITTRGIIQTSLARYGNDSNPDVSSIFAAALTDIESTIGDIGENGQALVLQAQLFAQDPSNRSAAMSVLSATGPMLAPIQLPWSYPNGSAAYLGDADLGYPKALYPNLTIVDTITNGIDITTAVYEGERLEHNSTLILGPLTVNGTLSLLSVTTPVLNSSMRADVLGWLTVVMDATLIQNVINAPEGLGDTGQTLLVGPVTPNNLFRAGILWDEMLNNSTDPPEFDVRYLFPLNQSLASRHPSHVFGSPNSPFPAKAYPAVQQAISEENEQIDNTGSWLSTTNEAGLPVSVGFALAPSALVDWVIVVEQSQSEVWAPINELRNILLICLFSVVAFITFVSFPLAHFAISPIRRLRNATAEAIDPTNPSETDFSSGSLRTLSSEKDLKGGAGFASSALTNWQSRNMDADIERRMREDKPFRIPNKVRLRKHWINDELTELTSTFNEMSDELFVQYARLEERVRQRTVELEASKKAAEAANESKTLFIANISHELKTPLNGILGMTAVCMQEDDQSKIKQSLGIIYKSGDLLLKLLTDLLTFSRNQVGQQGMILEEREFRLRDVEEQILALFTSQAQEKKIKLEIHFENHTRLLADHPSLATGSSEDIRDTVLWGDPHRILQVVINLVSNSLKFTPDGGRVCLLIRCSEAHNGHLAHSSSRVSSTLRRSQTMERKNSLAYMDPHCRGTACLIKPLDQGNRELKSPDSQTPLGQDLQVLFEVRDTGPGIPTEMQQQIFEPFVQGDIGLSRRHGGAGLGLSICSQLANMMGGNMCLVSTPGQGSTFSMQIPLRHVKSPTCSSPVFADGQDAFWQQLSGTTTTGPRNSLQLDDRSSPPEPEQPISTQGSASQDSTLVEESPGETPASLISSATSAASSSTCPPNGDVVHPQQPPNQTATIQNAIKVAKQDAKNADPRNIRVLVAEDNKVNQEVVLRMLKLEKVTNVTVANDGQEALDLVKASLETSDDGDESPESPRSFDIIFMDIQMPVMDGHTSTKLIREALKQCAKRTPIIALTAFAEESNVKECYASGMDYFLAKPIRRPQLKKVLTDFCPKPETMVDCRPVAQTSESAPT